MKLDENSLLGQEFRKTRGKPGPGAYRPDFAKTAKNNGSFSFRERPKRSDDNGALGPGTYRANSSGEVKQSPSFRFGGGPMREPLPKNRPPGPGNYKIPCEIGNMPQYTMARPKEFGYI